MDKNYIKNNNHNEFISTKEFNKSENQENNKIKNNEKKQKINNLIKKNIGKQFYRSNFKRKFNENEKGIKNICNLLDNIYDNNTNSEQTVSSNRIIYEVIFDLRDSLELIEKTKKNHIKNKEYYENLNLKDNNIESLINCEQKIDNNFSNYNYENENQWNKENFYINKIDFSNVDGNKNNFMLPVNNNYEINHKENLYINSDIKKEELILPNNYESINEKQYLDNAFIMTYNALPPPNERKITKVKKINNNNNFYNLNNGNFQNIINDNKETNQIYNLNYNKDYNQINNKILTLRTQEKNFYVIENDLPKKMINTKINKKKFENIKSSNNAINNKKEIKEEKINNIYNKKKFIKENKNKIISNGKRIKTESDLDSFSPNKKSNFDYSIIKRENEITINYSEKNKTRKSKFFGKEEICKDQEIFIEKSTIKNDLGKNEKLTTHHKNLSTDQITRKYFTIIGDIKNNNLKDGKENSLNSNCDNESKDNSNILKSKLNDNKKKTKKNKIEQRKKEKEKYNQKIIKHSKMPKKQPVVNIQIDLKDLIKLETMEKINNNQKKFEEFPKKTKECYDYPEDLKYNVFGKQYKFSYKDK